MTGAHASSYRVTGIALALAGVIAFSFRPVLIKLAYAYVVDPVTLIALRMIFSLPFFLIAAWLTRGAGAAIAPRDWLAVAFLGFLGYYASSFLDFLGLQYIAAGLGRLLLFIYPTIVVVLSALFLKKPVTRREVAALFITYLGLFLVLAHAFGAKHENVPLGAALVFASAALYAIYLVVGSQVVARVGSVRFTAYAMTIASACVITQFLALRPLSALDLPPQVYGLSIAMALGSTVLPVFMTSEALRRIGANHVAIIGAVGPVTTIFFGWIGLEETMTALQFAGALLVLVGVILVSLKPGA